jgi:hypothetical protein
MNEKAILEWAKDIISGVGGLKDLYTYECAVDNLPHDETVVVWTLKCLANPRCEGSKSVLDEILTAQEGEYLGRSKEYWLDLERYAVEQEYPAGYFDKEDTAQEGERVNFTDAELAEHQEAWDAYGKLTAHEGEADRETQEVTRQLVERYVSYEEIAERVYLEYLDWIAEWDGDNPNVREGTGFIEYLEEMR